MPLHDLIFSDKRDKRLQRHLLFWLVWWLYFSFCDYLYQLPIPGSKVNPWYLNVGSYLLVKTFLLIIVYAVACYVILYFIMPTIVKRKWLAAISFLILVCALSYVTVHFLFWNGFPYINHLLNTPHEKIRGANFWPAVNLGVLAPLKIIASAVIIKYVKNWWLKQKESERLDREKVNAELQLLKAQVHPDFLFKTLNNIYTHALSSSPRTPGMLLKLSDLLSYMLYECDRSVVPLEKEINMMKEYMQLENIRYNDEPEIEVNVKGDLDNKYIAPFLLLPFIETSFKHSGEMTEQSWINLDIRVEDDNFSMKLTNGIPENVSGHSFGLIGLANVQKRLTLLYPGKHELKITAEQEMLIVLLNIRLDETSEDTNDDDEPLEIEKSAELI